MNEYGIVRELVTRLAKDAAALGRQRVAEVRLRPGAHAAQTRRKPVDGIAKPKRAHASAFLAGQTQLRGENRGALPAVDEALDSLRTRKPGKILVGSLARLALARRGQAGRCALERQAAHSCGSCEREVERNSPPHRVAVQITARDPGGIEHRFERACHGVEGAIARIFARNGLAMAGQVGRENPRRLSQQPGSVLPCETAAGEAVKQQ